MNPLDLKPAPNGAGPDHTPDLFGTVRNWANSNGRPLEGDPEPAALLDDIRQHDPLKADKLQDALDRFPAVGTEFAGFKLITGLGRGAFGRVYLAQQADLAERYVVVKISTDLTGESRVLAQLQHTNIVPIYSVHRTHLLQAVCMPFFGSATVAGLLLKYRRQNSLPTTGRELVSTLNLIGDETDSLALGTPSTKVPFNGRFVSPHDPGSADGPAADVPHPRRDPSTGVLNLLSGLSYVDAVCWMGARLADALAHAHDRGIVHNDLKPANVLLTDEGQPMLLDFGVSEDLKLRSAARTAPVGGTLPYMSPEQLESVRAPVARTDARSDVYSLGIILFELLTGRHPFRLPTGGLDEELPKMTAERRAAPPRLRPLNRAISPGLESIVRKCLEPDPARRYQSAADLRDDLERHRADLPLRHAADPSVRERLQKWSRRHPRLTSNLSLAVMSGILAALLAAGYDRRSHRLARLEAVSTYQRVEPDLKAAQYLLSTRAPDADMVASGVQRCRAALDRYGVLSDPRWQERPAYRSLTPDEQAHLRGQLSDLALLLARGLALQGPSDNDRLAEALRLNELAERLTDGDVPQALWAQRAELEGRLGRKDEAAQFTAKAHDTPVVTVRDHYLRGTDRLTHGEYREALKSLRQAADLDPSFFWPHMAQGLCHESLGQLADARACYSTAIALWPDFPWGYYNRGLIALRQGDNERAKADFDKVTELTPDFTEAYVQRALARQGLRQYAEGVRDLDRAQELGADPTRVLFMRSLLRHLAGDKEGAKRDRDEGMRREPTDDKGWVARGVARIGTDLPGALKDFDAALSRNPRSLAALQNKSHVLTKLGRYDEAVKALDRVLELYPDFVPARSGRAVLYGRLGNRQAAVADAEDALARDPGPSIQYQVAGVYALLTKFDPTYKSEAIRLLGAALRAGFGLEYIETDKDLDPIRDAAEFKRLLDGARSLNPAAVSRR